MKELTRKSIKSGITFGIIHIFFVLIGFNVLIATLFAKLIGVSKPDLIPAPVYLLLYTGLVGIWAGAVASKRTGKHKNRSAVLQGLVSGFTVGVLAGILNIGLALLLINKIDFRNILTVLSFDFIKGTLFGLPPLLGILATVLCFTFGGALGGTLVGLWRSKPVQDHYSRDMSFINSFIEKVRLSTRGKHHLLWQVIPISLLVLAVVLLPLRWGSYWNYVFGTVGLYVILGLGLNIIVGLSGQLVLGYIAFFAIGAYTMALLNAPVPHNLMWGFWPALLLGIVLAAFAGLLLGLPLMRLRGDYLAIVTLGFGEIIRILLKSDMLTDLTGGPRGIQNISGPTLFGRPFSSDINFIYLIVGFVLLSIFVYRRLQHSRTGRAWLAIQEDETVARATGVNTIKYKLLALVIGAAFAGLAGGIFASRNQFTGPDDHALMASINVLSLIIVGGLGNIPGTILGAFALKGLPEVLREFANFRLLAFGALLVAMMVSRPEGLIPSRRPKFHLSESTPPDVSEKEDEDAK